MSSIYNKEGGVGTIFRDNLFQKQIISVINRMILYAHRPPRYVSSCCLGRSPDS